AAWDGLSGAVSGAHIHLADKGTDGGVIQDLTSLVSGNKMTGTINCSPTFIDSLLMEKSYINVHTAMNPGGEIRGQILTNPIHAFDAVLDTAQETGAVTGANGFGVAHFHLSEGLDSLHVMVQFSG